MAGWEQASAVLGVLRGNRRELTIHRALHKKTKTLKQGKPPQNPPWAHAKGWGRAEPWRAQRTSACARAVNHPPPAPPIGRWRGGPSPSIFLFFPLAAGLALPGRSATTVRTPRLAARRGAWLAPIGRGKRRGTGRRTRAPFPPPSPHTLFPLAEPAPAGISDWPARAVARQARRRGAELPLPMSRL